MSVKPDYSPVPEKLCDEVREHLVDTGLLERKYLEWLEEIVQIKKDIIRGRRQLDDINGDLVDLWLERVNEYLERVQKLLVVVEFLKKSKL